MAEVATVREATETAAGAAMAAASTAGRIAMACLISRIEARARAISRVDVLILTSKP